MKIIKLCVLLLFLSACSKDDGNYDYIDPGTVDFFGMITEMNALVGEPLFIEGVFSTTANESDLEFLWYIEVSAEGEPTQIDTISTTKDLDIINSLPVGNIRLHYNVYNRVLKVNYRHTIEIVNGSEFALGWGVLKDMGDGTADYDFISTITGNHLENNLLNLVGERIQGTPVLLNYYVQLVGLTGAQVWLSLYTDQTAHVYKNSNLELTVSGLDEYFSSSAGIDLPITGGIPRREDFTTEIGFLNIGGRMYSASFEPGRLVFPTWSNTPVTIDDDYQSTITGAYVSYSQYYNMYDELHNRYCYVNLSLTSFKDLRTYTVDTSTPFDPNDLGDKTCLWMGSGGKPGISLVKDSAGTYYLQKYSVSFGPVFTANYEVQVPDGLINDESVLLAGNDLGFVYFSNGGTIGRFIDGEVPTSANFEQDYITDYSTETVTAMYRVIRPGTPDDILRLIAIGLEGAGGSSLVLYDIGTNTEIARYDVEGKIVDIKYVDSFPY